MSGAVFPPYYLTWGQTMVDVMKIMATSFKKSMHALLHLVCPNPHQRYPKSHPRYYQVHSPGSLGNGKVKVKSLRHITKSCLTLWDPMDYSLPGFSIHGIFQAGVLAWVAISFSRGSSQPRDWIQVFHVAGKLYPLNHLQWEVLSIMCFLFVWSPRV